MPKSPENEGVPRLMTVTEIAQEHGVSRQSVHSYRTRGTFPKPVEGEGSTRPRFRADEVAAWFAANPPSPGKRTDLTPPPQGEPVPTTTDPRSDLYAFAMDGKEHSPGNSERASERIDAFRAAVVIEVVEALQERAGELSKLAEEKMSDALEDKAQVWHEAAEMARRLKRKAEAQDG
ncbi:helix-turn-helix domain-containing protein [Streptomyces sp. L2]|uniref:helix-turn-helix transcriptional regulator n=1 Tax=Streptomyces sp. L2 TaxID=2162665 RepID=UPI0019D71BEC|nr:helix-turn-helix domain-containing protein [Streptomyces sp. L2]